MAQSDLANQMSSTASIAQNATHTVGPLPLNQASDNPRVSNIARDDKAKTRDDQSTFYAGDLEQTSIDRSNTGGDTENVVPTSDLWSAAFREAVASLGKDIDVAILKGKNVEHLFRELDEIDKEATQESAFLRGVKYLHSVQVPLERFKLTLDLASPLTSLEPTVTTVFGVVRGVTAVRSFR